jgi:GxxExxY protein
VIIHHEGTKLTKITKVSSLALSYTVIGSAIEVHRVIGPGLLESVYEMALCRELWLRGVEFERQVAVPVHYKGGVLSCDIRLDLVVKRSIIVEVKSVDKLKPVHRAQLLTYLRLQGLWLGLLINFNVEILKNWFAAGPKRVRLVVLFFVSFLSLCLRGEETADPFTNRNLHSPMKHTSSLTLRPDFR